MKLYIITFEKVDYEEDYGVLVSANNEEEAMTTARIQETKPKYNSRYFGNIESIKEIGTYNKDISEEVLSSNRGA